MIAGVVLLCGGCGLVLSGGSDEPSTTQTTAARATTPRTTTSPPRDDRAIADLSYIAALDKNQVPYRTKTSAIELAHTVCEARQAGNTAVAVALEIAGKGFSPQEAGVIVGAAQAAYCPRFN